jgi:4-hydroxyacetophenone monooxygenase
VTTISIRPSEEPITENDEFIRRAVHVASTPALMMSLIHMSGDRGLLDGTIRPRKAIMNDIQSSMTDEERARIAELAVKVLSDYRDRDCTLPSPPDRRTILEMMSFIVGEHVADQYVPMMLEELALDGTDQRSTHWEAPAMRGRAANHHVVVIGAGMSGVLAAIRLEEAGIPYIVIEKNDAVGGTWYENRYPGCRVDVASHFYSYSFDMNPDWSEYFSRRDELHDYFERCVDRYGIRKHIRFRTEVTRATWDDAASRWVLELRDADGKVSTLRADAIISAVGQLNRPRYPDIPGLEGFKGRVAHTGEWPQDLAWEGKRIAVVGTGASAFQLVPAIAPQASHVTVFQRSPVWMFPNPRYHMTVSAEHKWILRHVPYYGRWLRFLLFYPGSDAALPVWTVDPTWPHQDRSVNARNEQQRIDLTAYMRYQVGDDPQLLAKVVPDFPPGGKRMLQDNGSWLAALKRPNVDLITDKIVSVDETAVIDANGRRHEVDVIALATGFQADRFLSPMRIVGRGGAELREKWGDAPSAYLGITVPGFPNFFCLYGPGTNLAHAGSIIFHSECQVRYILGCVRASIEHEAPLDCREDTYDRYTERLRAALERMVWSHPKVSSWYKNARGVVVTTSPWLLVDYWRWTREPDLADYQPMPERRRATA